MGVLSSMRLSLITLPPGPVTSDTQDSLSPLPSRYQDRRWSHDYPHQATRDLLHLHRQPAWRAHVNPTGGLPPDRPFAITSKQVLLIPERPNVNRRTSGSATGWFPIAQYLVFGNARGKSLPDIRGSYCLVVVHPGSAFVVVEEGRGRFAHTK